jgi:DNA replication and repair protein RecF
VAFVCLMYLTHLSLTNFRNFARLDLDVPRGPLMLVGGNAQGKTSILEAVYFLATMSSFHAGSDRELINFIAARDPLAVARITAHFRRGETLHRLELRIIQESSDIYGGSRVRKEALLDGVKRKASELMGAFNAVLFLPQMMRVIEGSPEERRRYLNLAMAQALPHYAPVLTEYQRVLSQRNALLKQLSERGGDVSQLTYWDEQVALFGAQIISARIHAVKELERLAARFHHELTRGQEVLRLNYQPAYDPLPQRPLQYALPMDAPVDRASLPLDRIQRGFQERLERLHSVEIQRGITTTGPHRDELRLLGNGVDLGTYGSRGQGRTAMLSLKLAEVEWLHGKTGHWPVLLLDEVLAELDPARRADLLARISTSEQALLTTTDLDLFDSSFVERASQWRVKNGTVWEGSDESELSSGDDISDKPF